MNANVKGMLFTAGAVVVGILVAEMLKSKLPMGATTSAEGDE